MNWGSYFVGWAVGAIGFSIVPAINGMNVNFEKKEVIRDADDLYQTLSTQDVTANYVVIDDGGFLNSRTATIEETGSRDYETLRDAFADLSVAAQSLDEKDHLLAEVVDSNGEPVVNIKCDDKGCETLRPRTAPSVLGLRS